MLDSLIQRFSECGPELHPAKTKIVFCKDDDRRGSYPNHAMSWIRRWLRLKQMREWKRTRLQGYIPENFRGSLEKLEHSTCPFGAAKRVVRTQRVIDLAKYEVGILPQFYELH